MPSRHDSRYVQAASSSVVSGRFAKGPGAMTRVRGACAPSLPVLGTSRFLRILTES